MERPFGEDRIGRRLGLGWFRRVGLLAASLGMYELQRCRYVGMWVSMQWVELKNCKTATLVDSCWGGEGLSQRGGATGAHGRWDCCCC